MRATTINVPHTYRIAQELPLFAVVRQRGELGTWVAARPRRGGVGGLDGIHAVCNTHHTPVHRRLRDTLCMRKAMRILLQTWLLVSTLAAGTSVCEVVSARGARLPLGTGWSNGAGMLLVLLAAPVAGSSDCVAVSALLSWRWRLYMTLERASFSSVSWGVKVSDDTRLTVTWRLLLMRS